MKGLLKLLKGIILFSLAIAFVKWHVKGHLGKYFIFFWLNTIIAICLFVYNKEHAAERYPNGWMVE